MSRSVTMNYERYRAPSGSHLSTATGDTMPRYSEALNEILENVSAPPPRPNHAEWCNKEHPPGKTPCAKIVRA